MSPSMEFGQEAEQLVGRPRGEAWWMLEPNGSSSDKVGHDIEGNKHFAEDTGLARLPSGKG